MDQSGAVRTHPVLACAGTLGSALDDVADVDAVFMTADQKRDALVSLTTVLARVQELRLRVLAASQAAGDVAEADGARDAAAWLAHHTRLDPGRARHLTRLATTLETRYTTLATALRAGHVDLAQAQVISRALDDLSHDVPEDLDPDIVRQAETRLITEAAHFDPRRLRILGRRILDIIAPEIAEDHERRQLQDEEAHARHTTYLRLVRRGDATTDLHARLPDTLADRLLTYLHAYTSPRHPDQPPPPPQARAQPPDRRPYDQRLGHALGAFLEGIDPTRLPLHGGDATTVIVTIDLDTLLDDLREASGVAAIGDTPITAAEARRLACTATLLPAVLAGTSEVLDLGRTRRLFTPAQRKALALAHPTCAAEGCDIPAPWCEAHHSGRPWATGGHTDLTHGTLLCSHHHHRAHDPRYTTTSPPDGTVHFHRRV